MAFLDGGMALTDRCGPPSLLCKLCAGGRKNTASPSCRCLLAPHRTPIACVPGTCCGGNKMSTPDQASAMCMHESCKTARHAANELSELRARLQYVEELCAAKEQENRELSAEVAALREQNKMLRVHAGDTAAPMDPAPADVGSSAPAARPIVVASPVPSSSASTKSVTMPAVAAEGDGTIVFEGWILKQSVSAHYLLKNWRRRHLTIRAPSATTLLGAASLTWRRAEQCSDDGRSYGL